jgi:hypothetical protein
MTPEQRSAARARCSAATPGPWEWTDWEDEKRYAIRHDDGLTSEGEFLSKSLVSTGVRNDDCPDAWIIGAMETVDGPFLIGDTVDAAFIKHARADLPAALDALDAADERVAELEKELAEMRQSRCDGERLIAWLDDLNRKPAALAFTAGIERQIADRFEYNGREATT